MTPLDRVRLGRICYLARHHGWGWDDLDEADREAWCRAADAVVAALEPRRLTPSPFHAVREILNDAKPREPR
jgi:hypothetical protein